MASLDNLICSQDLKGRTLKGNLSVIERIDNFKELCYVAASVSERLKSKRYFAEIKNFRELT